MRTANSFAGEGFGHAARTTERMHPVHDDGTLLVNLKDCLRPVVLPVLEMMEIPYRLVPDVSAIETRVPLNTNRSTVVVRMQSRRRCGDPG